MRADKGTHGGAFGDTAVLATSDVARASVYAAVDSKSKNLTVLVINKDQRANYAGKIAFKGEPNRTEPGHG